MPSRSAQDTLHTCSSHCFFADTVVQRYFYVSSPNRCRHQDHECTKARNLRLVKRQSRSHRWNLPTFKRRGSAGLKRYSYNNYCFQEQAFAFTTVTTKVMRAHLKNMLGCPSEGLDNWLGNLQPYTAPHHIDAAGIAHVGTPWRWYESSKVEGQSSRRTRRNLG